VSVLAAIRDLGNERADLIRLAEAVSLAVLIDPPLLRRARLELAAGADAGTEADLWLSPLVKSRSPDGIVLLPEAAEELRQRLRRDPERLRLAWEMTRTLHAHFSPAVRLEEEVAWLSVASEADAAQRIESLLRSVLAAMVVGERRGLARWAARALPMLPSAVRRSEAAQMLTAGAQLRLAGDAAPIRAREGMPDWTSWVAPADLPRVAVRVRLLPGAIELDAATTEGGNLLQLPATHPLLVDLSWEDAAGGPAAVQVTFHRGEKKRVAVPVQEIRLRTVLGEVYDLRQVGRAPNRLRDWIQDFTEERERHRPFFGRREDLARIEAALRDPSGPRLVVLTGDVGAGKTALLARLLDLREAAGLPAPHHFFRRGRRSEEVAAAERSLVAQIAAAFPEIEARAAFGGLAEVLNRVCLRFTPVEPLTLILDAVDEAEDGAGLTLLPEALPPGLAVVVSATNPQALTPPLSQSAAAWIELASDERALAEYWSHYARQHELPVYANERAERLSEGNFGVASLLNDWLKSGSRRPRELLAGAARKSVEDPGSSDVWAVIDAMVEVAGERGLGVDMRWLGVLAAARGPLPASALAAIVGADLLAGGLADTALVRQLVTDSEDLLYELREGVAKERLGGTWSGQTDQDRLIAEAITPAALVEPSSPGLRRYALRNAVHHWLAAHESETPKSLGRDAALAAAYQLGLNLTYLTEKCRVLGVDSARRELRRLAMATGDTTLSPLRLPLVPEALRILTEEAARIQQDPTSLPAIFYSQVRGFAYDQQPAWLDLDMLRRAFKLPAGVPMLRRARPPAAALTLWQGPPEAEPAPRRVPPARHSGSIAGCALLATTALSWSEDGTLKVWDLVSGALRRTLAGHQAAVTGCVLLDRDRAVSSSRDGTLRVWDVDKGTLLGTLTGHRGEVLGVESIDGHRVVSWSADRTLGIWDVGDGTGPAYRRLRWLVGEHHGAITACAVSRDQRFIVSGSADTTLRLWDVATDELVCVFRGHTAPVTGVVVLRGGTLVVSCSLDRTLRVWRLDAASPESHGSPGGEVAVRSPLATIEAHLLGILGCAVSGEDPRLATWSLDRQVGLWDLSRLYELPPVPERSGAELREALRGQLLEGHRGAVLAAAFVPGEHQLVTSSADGTVRTWNARTGGAIAVLEGHQGEVRALDAAVRPLRASRYDLPRPVILSGSDDRTLRLWRVDGSLWTAMDRGEDEIVVCLGVPGGSFVVTGSRRARVELRDLTGKSTALGESRVSPLGSLAGGVIARAAPRGSFRDHVTVELWDLPAPWDLVTWHWNSDRGRALLVHWGFGKGGEPAWVEGHSGPVLACALTPIEGRLLTASMDHNLCVWRFPLVPSAVPLAVLSGHQGPVADVQVPTSGVSMALSASWDGTLRVWNLGRDDAYSLLGVLSGHTDRVLACAISPDTRLAVSASADRTLRVWDLFPSGPRPLAVLPGHQAAVTGCAFTPGGGRIVSRSLDGTLGIWDVASGSRLATLRGHANHIHAFAIGRDPDLLYSCSEDRTVRAWDLETGEARGVFYGTSPIRALAAVDGGVYAGDEAGNVWVLEAHDREPQFASSGPPVDSSLGF
jgi:WD40 repeat protein